ncbi:MAG: hypothetical protein ACLR8Y_15065 [Alistipes indistinctus]
MFNRSTGWLDSYKAEGVEMLKAGYSLRPNFWRAPTDNDFRCKPANQVCCLEAARDGVAGDDARTGGSRCGQCRRDGTV